jgi:alpha-tubulin suppressor-like RCC1 family protein
MAHILKTHYKTSLILLGLTLVSLSCGTEDGGNTTEESSSATTTEQTDTFEEAGQDLTPNSLLAGSQEFTCAVLEGGVWCWGSNEYRQLGEDVPWSREYSYESGSASPVRVAGLEDGVTALSVGLSHACAIQNGGVKCWGSNSFPYRDTFEGGGGSFDDYLLRLDKLGNPEALSGSGKLSSVPVAAVGLESGVEALTAGLDHTCALRGGEVFCWGANNIGQSGQLLEMATPDPYAPAWGGSFHNNQLYENTSSDISIKQGRIVPIPTKVAGLEPGVRGISARNNTTCALTKNNEVMCWGDNSFFEMGRQQGMDYFTFDTCREYCAGSVYHYSARPIVVPEFSGTFNMLGSGCVASFETIQCVGWNNVERIEQEYTTNTTHPTWNDGSGVDYRLLERAAFSELSPVVVKVVNLNGGISSLQSQVVAYRWSEAGTEICAIVNKAVYCWAAKHEAVSGGGEDYYVEARILPGLERDVISLGTNCALKDTENAKPELWCWGYNDKGQVGNGERTDQYIQTPVKVVPSSR